MLVDKFLSRRNLQTNFGELDSFTLTSSVATLNDVDTAITQRAGGNADTLFVIDASDDDFGSRANFGRGHDHSNFEKGCPTSYEVFVRRLCNVAINKLNDSMSRDICLMGSINSSDLALRSEGMTASVDKERDVLIQCVKIHHQRLTNIMARVFMDNHSRAKGLYLVNGDHSHMLSAIAAVKFGLGVRPIVVYIDIHADSRPTSDGPHSGTWCSEAFENGWIEQVCGRVLL